MTILEFFNSSQFKETRTRVAVLAVATVAALVGLQPTEKDMPISASLIGSLPPASTLELPVQTNPTGKIVAQQEVRKLLPKQPPQYRVVSTVYATITSYNSEAAQTDPSPWYTADGTWCTEGVAAGPVNLPFGTKFRIPSIFGKRVFEIHDRSATPYGHFDIWMRYRKQNIGKHTGVKVEIIK
jgi:hypothetical protein